MWQRGVAEDGRVIGECCHVIRGVVIWLYLSSPAAAKKLMDEGITSLAGECMLCVGVCNGVCGCGCIV